MNPDPDLKAEIESIIADIAEATPLPSPTPTP
jgi:hypothetical protein